MIQDQGEDKNKGGRPPAIKSDAVRRLRDALGTDGKPISQDALARLLGCSVVAVGTAERKNRLFSKPEIMDKFAELANSTGVKIEVQK